MWISKIYANHLTPVIEFSRALYFVQKYDLDESEKLIIFWLSKWN